ncbi:Dabb family protein [Glutamicibacter sp. MNS18]|uniref:Dabb family protein n=1 Tax=Glutamicibacter sp. MNS18 TaxID=2989817 RepID=UPI002235D920|nr:Dabb family protein [Glutamicibacter sp. MNS18]MCW4466444.1 Dabb family protein [Glutamicibacter sp. MNS18]
MIRHIVMFRFSASFTEGIREQWITGLEAMKGNIPGMLNLEHGPDVMGTERSWDHVIVADFATKDDIAVYNTHPLHEAIKPFSLPNVEDLAYVDFEMEDPAAGSSRKG